MPGATSNSYHPQEDLQENISSKENQIRAHSTSYL